MKKQDNQRQAVLYAYLAGIIDGEGTIRINRSKQKIRNHVYSAAISVGNTNKEVIDLVAKTFGAKVRIERVHVPDRQPMYRWGTSGNLVVPKILKKLLPYLIIKRKQAELVLEYCNKPKKPIKKCRICKRTDIQGYSLCNKCYANIYRRGDIEKYKIKPASYLSDSELQRREEFYRKVRKLNAVGAAATTNREDTREGEVIVWSHR